MKFKKSFFYLSAVILFIGFWAYTSLFRISKNFYEIDPGKFYRSGQLMPWEMRDVVKKYKIKTIINLRGENGELPWEKPLATKLGINYYTVGMSSKEVPHRQALVYYLGLLEYSPRPILVHCRTGADRTGEATAIYAIEFMNQNPEKALQYLTPTYWHIDFLNPGKRFFIKNWKNSMWAWTLYDPCDSLYKDQFDQKTYCAPFDFWNCCAVDVLKPIFKNLSSEKYPYFYRALAEVYACKDKPVSFIDVQYCPVYLLSRWSQCSKVSQEENGNLIY